ncbi:hypothetical protein [Ruminiclostridium papyrosolvens]|uniref:Uncharacterized protein n=1 Tax=Ruminiclostridium papyrosolvens C7 TaxID=1330534 RepID=U4QYA8_9FIRM|nr:hypothetical protein [Ruminiclostridium papyrosolvens]EPR08147.1 hypothetical protein L323_18865 [Ruminiclostridium papyrosolvens C7]
MEIHDLSRFTKYSSCNKEIHVKLQREITTYLNYSLPLCAILWDRKKENWTYEHFTQLYCIKDKNDYLWLDYLEDILFPQDVSDYIFIPSDDLKNENDIIFLIKEKVSLCNCLMIFLDKYYISNSRNYLKRHDIFQAFIYGYDDVSNEFLGIGFQDNNTFDYLHYSYSDVSEAYTSCRNGYESSPIWVRLYACVLIKVKNLGEEHKCNFTKIISDMKNYVSSIGYESDLRYEIKVCRGTNATYGINVIKEVIDHLKRLLDDTWTIDYRHIHLLYEHKRLMKKRIEFLGQIYGFNDDKFSKSLSIYTSIEKSFETAKAIYMKSILAQTNYKSIYGCLKNADTIKKIISIYENEIHREEEILSYIIYRCSNG